MNEYMFKKVNCKAYMKKIKDGKCIIKNDVSKSQTEYFYSDSHKWIKVPDEDWGGGGFIKTYYERTEKKFFGIVIGKKTITVKAELFCDTEFRYDGIEIDYVGKRPTEQMEVLVVAYGCNRTRFVRLEDIEIKELNNE